MQWKMRRPVPSSMLLRKGRPGPGAPRPILLPRRPTPVTCAARSRETSCTWVNSREHVRRRLCTRVGRVQEGLGSTRTFPGPGRSTGERRPAGGTGTGIPLCRGPPPAFPSSPSLAGKDGRTSRTATTSASTRPSTAAVSQPAQAAVPAVGRSRVSVPPSSSSDTRELTLQRHQVDAQQL